MKAEIDAAAPTHAVAQACTACMQLSPTAVPNEAHCYAYHKAETHERTHASHPFIFHFLKAAHVIREAQELVTRCD